MSRLTTREAHVFKKKLDEIASLSRDKVAVLNSDAADHVIAYYQDGKVRRGRRGVWVPLDQLTGWTAWAVINKTWQPSSQRSPLELLAEAVDAVDEKDEDEQAIYRGL